jgi:uncharacterized membrane protein YccC
MASRIDYLREIQKFTTSQYLNSGLRITAGVMIPLLVLVKAGWLSVAIPFLWGALFVSLTDTPGPIHHRRNGMMVAIVLNAASVLLTGWTKEYQVLLLFQLVVFGFFLSLAGIYGARAGAVGSLALVITLLNLLSLREEHNHFMDSALIAAGGTWYMGFSLILYRLQPYRPVEQGLGENLIAIANYIRARATFYKEGADLESCFNRVMEEQSSVLKIQEQLQELLFKTRKFVSDASPKSRSMMMIYLDSLDLFEQTMHSYQDYEILLRALRGNLLLTQFYGLILQVAAELEHIGISIQTGIPVRKDLDLTARLDALKDEINAQKKLASDATVVNSLNALEKTWMNIRNIANRINKLVLYTRMEANDNTSFEDAQQVTKVAVTQPITWQLLRENLTLKSNTFRHSLRITVAMVAAYGISLLFSLTHTYWVLLTIVTIMKPVYSLTRKRNYARVGGTLAGVLLVSLLFYFVTSTTTLLVIMIVSMLIGYSLLRVNYFGFVVFLTVFVVISFHFLNPLEFKTLIRERLVDTVIGSVIAGLASRFVFPVWGLEELKASMQKMLTSNQAYFTAAWEALKNNATDTPAYEVARQEAVVALTNLSDNFQRMLSEPQQTKQSTQIHQFVIASHMLTSHIAALSTENFSPFYKSNGAEKKVKAIINELKKAEDNLAKVPSNDGFTEDEPLEVTKNLDQLSMIAALAIDIRRITVTYNAVYATPTDL